MKVVIEISDEEYETIKNRKRPIYKDEYLEYLIKNGIPLPKGHGEIIDVNEIRVIELEDSLTLLRHEKGDELDVYIDAPAIIEADRSEVTE